jgi:hypothetical protein
MRDAAKDANIAAARAFGFGGEVWTVARPEGAGIAAKTLTAQGTTELLAFRQRPGQQGAAGGGTPVLADIWRYIQLSPASGEALAVGDVIVSEAGDAYVFAIANAEPWYEYVRGDLERVRGPIEIAGL